MKFCSSILLSFSLLLTLVGCGDLAYFSQGVGGHLSLMLKSQSIEEVIADPDSADRLKQDLQVVMEARKFARDVLFMPVKNNFRTYADINRPYVVWNVVAAPAYSLSSFEWCYPVAGCLPYRGYFNRNDADSFAGALTARGVDVHVYGVPAYSTLGWFDDPVLSTYIHYPQPALVGLMFHELAHQLVYAESDGDFNEAFASAVEQEGVKRWLASRGGDADRRLYLQSQAREGQFYGLITETRQRLLECFDGRNGYSLRLRQACKENAFDRMRLQYRELKKGWGGDAGYDRWFEPGLNNARFISAHTYRYYIPAFEELLREHDGNLAEFYKAARGLAQLPRQERHQIMTALRKAATAAISDTSASGPGSAEKLTPKSGI